MTMAQVAVWQIWQQEQEWMDHTLLCIKSHMSCHDHWGKNRSHFRMLTSVRKTCSSLEGQQCVTEQESFGLKMLCTITHENCGRVNWRKVLVKDALHHYPWKLWQGELKESFGLKMLCTITHENWHNEGLLKYNSSESVLEVTVYVWHDWAEYTFKIILGVKDVHLLIREGLMEHT